MLVGPLRPARILIVDDDEQCLRALTGLVALRLEGLPKSAVWRKQRLNGLPQQTTTPS
jgi:hypothetical protein